ncbi:MAG: methyltransferase domain-containing protein [Candidatus Melainabacteria bacterium]
MSTADTPAEPCFWEDRYRNADTPWDLGNASPHWGGWLQAHPLPAEAPLRLLTPGCGRGHDAAYFTALGHAVTGVDFSAQAIAEAAARYGPATQFLEADLFSLAISHPELAGAFDGVIEHTCFCALPPERRTDYLLTMHALLKPGGFIRGVFWTHQQPGGPPYSVTVDELTRLCEGQFHLENMWRPAAITPGRGGREWLAALHRLP